MQIYFIVYMWVFRLVWNWVCMCVDACVFEYHFLNTIKKKSRDSEC